MPLLDLLPRELGLFRAEIPGVGFAGHRPCPAVVRAVRRFGILLAGATCLPHFMVRSETEPRRLGLG
jgi:hypothetical protein